MINDYCLECLSEDVTSRRFIYNFYASINATGKKTGALYKFQCNECMEIFECRVIDNIERVYRCRIDCTTMRLKAA